MKVLVTGADGWYRIDLGCVYDPYNNSSTTLMHVTHAAYREFSRVLGRGIHGVNRIDAELLPAHLARAALFLASDDSSMLTAQDIIVDGGWA